MIPLGHVAGIPVEETVLQFAPVAGVGLLVGFRLAGARVRKLFGAFARSLRPPG
jgi:hypothetical protein